MFPQIKGINTLFYYYSQAHSTNARPIILLPNETGASYVPADDPRVKRDILRAFFSALNPPQNLRERHYYHIEKSSLRDKEIHKFNLGGRPTYIGFNFGLNPLGIPPYSSLFYIGFYLTNPTEA